MTQRNLYDFKIKSTLSTARSMLKGAKPRKTIAVEGLADVRFFNQWFSENEKIRFVSLDGKPNVLRLHKDYLKSPLKSVKGMFFCVDIDWDLIHGKALPLKEDFLINSYCQIKNKFSFNDLESFLINSRALQKLIASYDLVIEDFNDFKMKIEVCSRKIGKYRAADDIIKNKFMLRNSVLNGASVDDFFDAENFEFNEKLFTENMPRWANYSEHIEDLVQEAEILDDANKELWSLSRGHDITTMLSLFIENKAKIKTSPEKIEKELRLSCEYADFLTSPMYEKMVLESLI